MFLWLFVHVVVVAVVAALAVDMHFVVAIAQSQSEPFSSASNLLLLCRPEVYQSASARFIALPATMAHISVTLKK